MLGEQLQIIRKELGFKSARAFYQSLHERAKLDFNYSYYMKIEAGQLLPSSKIIHQLAALLSKEYMERIILAYCASLFPRQAHLFSAETKAQMAAPPIPAKAKFNPADLGNKQMLTERQLAVLAGHKETYFLFLLLAIARQGMRESELTNFFGGLALEKAKSSLLQTKLAYIEGEYIFPSHHDYQLPAGSATLDQLLDVIAGYDQERDAFFKMDSKRKVGRFRRIPARYSDLINQNLDLLLQTIRMAESLDAKHNDLVLSLAIDFSIGNLPG